MHQINNNDFVFLPDEMFFVTMKDSNASLSDTDVKAMAESYLEENSPMPLDQLNWGVARAKDRILIFAAPSERLKYDGQDARFVMPVCAAVAGAPLNDGINIYSYGGCVSAFTVKGGTISAFFSKKSDPDKEVNENISDFAKELGMSDYFAYAFLPPKRSAMVVTFKLQDLKSGALVSWKIKSASLLRLCDVRSRRFLSDISKRNIRSKITALAMVFAVASLFFLCAWQVFVLAQKKNILALREDLKAMQSQASVVEAMSEQVSNLRTFYGIALVNVKLLGIVNEGRPKQIEFTRTLAKSPSLLEIAGKSDSFDSVNKYVALLKQNSKVKNVEYSIPLSKAGSTQFTLTVEFNNK